MWSRIHYRTWLVFLCFGTFLSLGMDQLSATRDHWAEFWAQQMHVWGTSSLQEMQSLENVVGLVILGLSSPWQNLQRLCSCCIQRARFLIKHFLSCSPADTIQDVLPDSGFICSSCAFFLFLLTSTRKYTHCYSRIPNQLQHQMTGKGDFDFLIPGLSC